MSIKYRNNLFLRKAAFGNLSSFKFYSTASLMCDILISSSRFLILVHHHLLFVTLWFSFVFPFISFPSSAETTEEPLVDLADVLNTGADILGVLGKPSGDSGASNIFQAATVTE